MVNQWDRTPWMIGGGAKHSVNVGRLLSYAAFGNSEGIIGSKDLEVRAQATPDGTVRVFPGACAILNRGLNVVAEAYAARLPTTDDVAISATGSGASRSDLIVAVVMDPFQSGSPWPDPRVDGVIPENTEFVKTLVIPNVPASTTTVTSLGLGYSAIPLARIDIPASTATITQAMITDLRRLAQVKREPFTKAQHAVAPVVLNSGYKTFPVEATTTVEIPTWATHVTTLASVVNFLRQPGNVTIEWSLRLEGAGGGPLETYTYVDLASSDLDRMTAFIGPQRHAVPAAWRGTNKTFVLQAKLFTGSAGASIDNAVTAFNMEARFEQSRESNA